MFSHVVYVLFIISNTIQMNTDMKFKTEEDCKAAIAQIRSSTNTKSRKS